MNLANHIYLHLMLLQRVQGRFCDDSVNNHANLMLCRVLLSWQGETFPASDIIYCKLDWTYIKPPSCNFRVGVMVFGQEKTAGRGIFLAKDHHECVLTTRKSHEGGFRLSYQIIKNNATSVFMSTPHTHVVDIFVSQMWISTKISIGRRF
jgi:hypothetical protein